MASNGLIVNHADNFLLTGRYPMPTDPVVLTRPDVRFDLRTNMITFGLDTSDMQWYYNYIDSARHFAAKNPTVYSTFLLDAGYVPVIYLPIDTTDISDKSFIYGRYYGPMLQALMDTRIKYMTFAATTFTPQRLQYGNITDAWVSKMDAAAVLNMAPDEITSDDIIEEVIKCLKL